MEDTNVTVSTKDRSVTTTLDGLQRAADRMGAALDELDYRRSEEVEWVARDLIEKHAVTFGQVRDLQILYLLRRVEGEMDAKVIDALAKCVKAPTLWRDAFGVDVAIWVDERYWSRFDERQRHAVVLHELLHIGVNPDTGKVKLLDHDVEEFGLVVATYGQWRPDIERFAQQLAMFEEDAPPERKPAKGTKGAVH